MLPGELNPKAAELPLVTVLVIAVSGASPIVVQVQLPTAEPVLTLPAESTARTCRVRLPLERPVRLRFEAQVAQAL